MQRQLHQSLRLLCRQQCRRRLYSVQAAALQHHASDNTPNEPVASTSSRSVDTTDVLKREETPDGSSIKATSSAKKNKHQPLPSNTDNTWSGSNKVDNYLASLRAEGIEPTIEDLLRLTPRDAPAANSPKYAIAYAALVERLCRTFSKSQLRRFCQELKLGQVFSRLGRKKIEYAEAIIEEQWGWENLKELEKRKRDTSEVNVKSFPVSASELFLLLGKDGSELLQISTDYNVHISVMPDPLSIRIEGFRGSIKKLEAMIAERRKSIMEETVELQTNEPLSSSLLQQVSRTANAFIENVGYNGKIRIRANSSQRLAIAKRLALRAAVHIKHNFNTPFAALLPPPPSTLPLEISPSSYALFPFVPQRSLPWTSAAGSTFRSRKISDWLGDSGEDLTSFSADVAGRKGRLLSINGELSTLEDVIERSFQNAADSYVVTASTGHVLIMANSEQDRPSILPPLAGRWQYSELMDWMKRDATNRIFVPCLPPPLHSAPPVREEIVHRLIYRHVPNTTESPGSRVPIFSPTKVIHAEVIINRQRLEEPDPPVAEPEKLPDSRDQEENSIKSQLDGLFIEGRTQLDHPSEGTDAVVLQPTEREVSDSLDNVDEKSPASFEARLEVSATEDVIPEQLVTVVKAEADSFGVKETEISVETEVDSSSVKETEASLEDVEVPGSADVDKNAPQADFNSEPMCRKGRELEFLVALPDRPMDLKLTVLGSVDSVPVDNLAELNRYFEALKAYLDKSASEPSPPEPPLFIEDGEDRYILELNASVRRSTESLDLGRGAVQDLDSLSLDGLTDRRISTTTESIYDLESGQKLVNCQIACNQAPSGEAWALFLRNIDEITSLGYKTKHSSLTSNRFSLDDRSSIEDTQLY